MLRFWRRASLRSQLVTVISALLAVSLVALGLISYFLLRGSLIDQMDSRLKIFQSAIPSTGFSPSGTEDMYYQMVSQEGVIVLQSPMTAAKPDLTIYSLPEATALNAKPFDIQDHTDSTKWRAMIVAPVEIQGAVPKDSGPGYVLIAITYTRFDESINRLALVMFLAGVLVVAVGTMIAFWTVSRSFRPLVRVERTAAAIAAGDLSQRVQIQNPATEVGRLSESLNTMLAHIEAAFEARTASEQRMRRFIADASHELRTPLVTIRGFSELYRHGALASNDDVHTAMGRIESEAKRMGALVEDLLVLARIDEQRPLDNKQIDLLVLGNDAAVDARASVRDRRITVVGLENGPAVNAPVMGDEAKLRQVVVNLMANALRYTPEGTPIEVAIGTTEIDGQRFSTLQIRDHGPGIDEEESGRIFERFYRAETSRNRDTGGSGLGLAIVSAIIASHRGKVRVSQTSGGGATLTIQLPYRRNTLMEEVN
ncbi:two-component system OmpR family sensor kinase [Psychromicrobium silvestre]|uniref:histidine kinase n=1 Tax=Psychromicrobium silvestre TaxID=1645614 RepID=A0A7Y9LVF9_9MICC|nr:HAMP domain-containing sensor histidine kinase [Psychromicrobium silvestre]NYE96342.1 two-component system OmpR family sensor kinase [Psychromicrobium silvestre]